MEQIWAEVKTWYRSGRVECQFTSLDVAGFTDKKKPRETFPKLKGRGAEVRDLVWPLLETWNVFRKDNEQHRRISRVLKCQVDLQTVLHEHASETFLPDAVAKDCADIARSLLKDYSLLCNQADREKKALWSMAPIFHYLYHLGQRAAYLNPRKGNCMIDEDYVGHCKKLVVASTHGTEAHVVPMKVMERYSWGHYMVLCHGI